MTCHCKNSIKGRILAGISVRLAEDKKIPSVEFIEELRRYAAEDEPDGARASHGSDCITKDPPANSEAIGTGKRITVSPATVS